jgi:copper chaperone CopZ
MKNLVVAFSAVVVLGACSSEPKEILLRTEKGVKETKAPVAANRVLTMEIEGMTCEMGCGGSIRKELKATGAVARVEFPNFKEGAKVQTARVSFDTNKITADEMIKIVTTMNEKQFTVGKTSSEVIDTPVGSSSTEATDDSKEDQKVEIVETSYSMPNLLDILSGFVL